MQKKTDKRVQYTMGLLQNALIELLQTQHISRITVKALCEHAGVHRTTFYAHFGDAYDFFRYLEQDVIENINKYLGSQSYDDKLSLSEQKLISVLEYAKKNADLLKALMGANSDETLQNSIMQFGEYYPFELKEGTDERTMEYLTLYSTSGGFNMIYSWLLDGTPESCEHMAKLMLKVMFHGMAGFETAVYE